MTPQEFTQRLKALGFSSPGAAAAALGIDPSHAFRLAAGTSGITRTMQRLLVMYERFGVPKDWLRGEDSNL